MGNIYRNKQFFTLSIANQKGGVAKTTTALSLGGALAQYNQKVLLIDLDTQGNLSLALNTNLNNIKNSIADVFLRNSPVNKLLQETDIPDLYLIPSNQDMMIVEKILNNRNKSDFILRNSLSNIDQVMYFDYIIFDCPPSIGAITINALSASHLLIIPTQPEYFSVNALQSMMNLIREVRNSTNPDLVYRILITMLDRRNSIHRLLSEQIKNTFNYGLFQTIIETDTKLRESVIYGLPITFYKHKTRSAIQYSTLAQELIEYVTQKEQTAI